MLDLILANVRTPVEREGDLLAQCMAIKRGEQRLLELAGKYGLPTLRRNMAALKDYSERMMRSAIRRLPSGTYRAEDYLDNDGITDRPVKIVATVSIRGDRASVDFTGSDAQVEGSVNANYAVAGFSGNLCLPLPGARRYSVHLRRDAAARCDRSERASGQRSTSRRHGRGQRRDIAANHRRHSRGARASGAPVDSRRQFGNDEQSHLRGLGPGARPRLRLL